MCQKEECSLIETGWWVNVKKHQFTRGHFIKYNEINDFINAKNCPGLFSTVFKYNSKNQDEAFKYGDLYFDFDEPNDFEKVREDALRTLAYLKVIFKIDKNNCNVYFSGNKGVHITVPAECFNIQPRKDLNSIFKYLADKIFKYTTYKTLDMKIYDSKRLYRLPNTINEKTGLYKIPLTINEIQNAKYSDIISMAHDKRIITNNHISTNQYAMSKYSQLIEEYIKSNKNIVDKKYKTTINIIPPCIKKIISEGVKQGCRNNTVAALASFYKRYGLSENECIKYLSEWNSAENTPPIRENELARTVRSMYSSSKNYGCTFLKTVVDCNPEECQLMKMRKR